MQIKKLVRIVHLWLGLASGLVIVFLGITGCILAFQAEIENFTQPYRFVDPQQKTFLAPSVLQAKAEKALPGKHIHAVMYQGKSLAANGIFFQYEENNEAETYYYTVYLNPYDGAVLKVKNMDDDFFRIVLNGHFYLWLPPRIGQPIVASATLIFLLLMISGIILWWPKNKKVAAQRFSIKWSARWRRKNFDLHSVFGFYMTWLAIFLAVTGLVWGFQWFASSLYFVTGGTKSLVYEEPLSDSTSTASFSGSALDRVWQKMQVMYPNAEAIEVHPPETAGAPIAANANPDRDTYYKLDYRYFDQYTLKELNVDHIYGRYSSTTAADKIMRMNYDVHTGAILGLAGKIMMFCASLIAASLPVTGVLMWLGRKKKKKESMAKKPISAKLKAEIA